MPSRPSRRLPRRRRLAPWAGLAALLPALAAGSIATFAAAFAAAPAWSQPAPAAEPATLQVQRFEIDGNTLLPAERIQRRLDEYRGEAGLQRLREAAAAVQELYRHAGYGGVVAFLPEQKPQDGVVRIRVVEGRLERIEIAGNHQFGDDNIRASLPALATGRTPEVRLIDSQIQLANENPAKNIQVLLQPGESAGGIAARITVEEQPVRRWMARLDNTGSDATGRWRAALGWQHANVGGRDHIFSAELQTAPEDMQAVAVLSAAYRAPLYGPAMAIDAYAAWSDVDAGKVGSAAGDLQFSGRGSIAGLRATAYLPRREGIDQRLSLAVESREYRNQCTIEGLPEGACGAAGASVSVQPLALAWSAQTGGDLRLGAHVSLHHGLGLGGRHGDDADFEAVRSGAERRYTLLRASGQATLLLDGGSALATRVAGQYSGEALVPGELFGIGGQSSVRGFEERELAGDSGLQASVEWISANVGPAWFDATQGDWRWLLFADAGWVSTLQGQVCRAGQSRCRIGAIGAGLRLGLKQWQLRMDLARALNAGITTARGDMRVHFGLMAHF